MSDEKPSNMTFSQGAEIIALHLIVGTAMRFFFKWQGAKHSWWEAGDESALAQTVTAMVDIAYWLFKPRIMKWRGSDT